MSGRSLLALACALASSAGGLRGSEAPLAHYDKVEVASTKTSIYIGSVALTLPAFTRMHGTYESSYVAKVFPFFFMSETGRLGVELPDEALRRLVRGESVEFKGRAANAQGEERRVEGKATPVNAAGGKIKVRVFVSKRIELIFNTTYRFPAVKPAPAAPP